MRGAYGERAAGGRLDGDHPEGLGEGARHDDRLAHGQQQRELLVVEAPGERRALGAALAPPRDSARAARPELVEEGEQVAQRPAPSPPPAGPRSRSRARGRGRRSPGPRRGRRERSPRGGARAPRDRSRIRRPRAARRGSARARAATRRSADRRPCSRSACRRTRRSARERGPACSSARSGLELVSRERVARALGGLARRLRAQAPLELAEQPP